MTIRLAIPFLLATLLLGGAASARPLYAIARIGSAIDDGAVIGKRRAGLACFPNGRVRWSDVATGGTMDQREVVQDALEDAGVAMTPLGIVSESSTALRLRGTVQSAGFDVCARGFGLGGAKAYSGKAALVVEWRLEGSTTAPAIHTSSVSRTVTAGEATSLGGIYRKLLGDAARDAAVWLATPRN